MLKYIYLHIDVNEDYIKEFATAMIDDGIVVIDVRKKCKADGQENDNGIDENILEKLKLFFEGEQNDYLLITDNEAAAQAAGEFVVGYGLDYKGKTSYIIESLLDTSAKYFRMIYAHIKGETFEILRTDRLIIREIALDDLSELYEVYETLADCKYIEPLYDWESEKEFTVSYIKNMYQFFNYGLWLVFEKETGRLVGRVGIENREIDGELRQELGYLIRKDCQRKGYAYEACSAIMEYAKEEIGIERLFLCSEKENKPSVSLAQKLGFKLYASLPDGMNIYNKLLVSDF